MNKPEYRLTTAGYLVSFVEIWRRNGRTKVRYYKNGLKAYEEWRIDGWPHRLDGPAKRKIEPSGNTYLEFWLHRKQYFFEDWIEIAKEHISHERYLVLKKQYGKKDDGER